MGVLVKRTLGRRVKDIAYKHGIPVITVETIIKGYLNSLRESLENGERVVIDGITSISVYKDEKTGEYYVRGRVSSALKERLYAKNASD